MEIVCRSKCEHFDCGEGICVTTGNGYRCDCNDGFINFNDNPSLPCGKKSIFYFICFNNYILKSKKIQNQQNV